MMKKTKKNIFNLNEELNYDYCAVYFNKKMNLCIHENISFDDRDNYYKCIYCLMKFDFKNLKQLENFKKRFIIDFDFKKAEENIKKEVMSIKRKEIEQYEK